MTSKLFTAIGVGVFLFALAAAEVAAQGITVAPADRTIAVGQTQQFTATGVGAATALEAGAFHTCALLQDGGVRCWGLNDLGQLGDGTRTSSSNPVGVVGLAGAVAVSGGGYHTCARFPDGTLACWGRNDGGQLGTGAITDAVLTPAPVTGITGATAVTAGAFHTCALLQDGTVRCWGENTYGELGDGSVVLNSPTPVTVSGLSGVTAISASGWHTCALLQNGTLRCWGRNDEGQLGNGTVIASSLPVQVTGITTAAAVASGVFATCARLQDGSAQCWGRNVEGQLGNGSTTSSSVPVTVTGLAPAVLAPGAEHSCAGLPDGSVQCWGDNNYGQLGNGGPVAIATTPAPPVTGVAGATFVSSGAVHTCALVAGGAVRCWGQNGDGRLGNGTTTDARTSVGVGGVGTTWTSSDANVASIDSNGLATGRSPGSAVITVASDGRTGSTTLRVVSRVSLAVIREGAGTGSVTSNPSGIDCGATCTAFFDQNTAVTLTATPVSGYTFQGWTGGGCAGTGPCTVTLTANTTVSARFGLPRFTLTVTRDGAGTGSVTSNPAGISCGVTCSASYDRGTPVTLTATPTPGFTFEGWTGGGCSGTGICTVTLTADTTVSARFGVLRFSLTIDRQGSGTVTSSPAGIDCGSTCSASYNSGTQVTLTASPGLLYVFVGWSGGGCSGTGRCTVTMGANTTVTARFRLLGLL